MIAISPRDRLSAAPMRSVRPFGFFAAFLVMWIVVLAVGATIRPPKGDVLARLLFGDVERLLCWLLLPTLWLILLERRPIASGLHPVAPRSPFWTMPAAVALCLILLLGMKLTRGQWHAVSLGYSAPEYLAVAISIGLLALGEEFVFRGVLLSGLARRGWPFWMVNLVAAIAFAASHWPGWLMFGGMAAPALVTATARVLVFGLLMGGLVRLEGGLIAAIFVHWFNDLLARTLF